MSVKGECPLKKVKRSYTVHVCDSKSKVLTLNSMERSPFLRLRLRTSRKSMAGMMSRDTSIILFSSRAAASEDMSSRTMSTHHMVHRHMTAGAEHMTHCTGAPHSTLQSYHFKW